MLPENLLRHARDNHDAQFHGWLRELPDIVDEYAARWSLQLQEPYQPGGTCSWVAAADGDRVLKVSWRHYEADDEAAGLATWSGHGAVRVHASEQTAVSSVLLLERCTPGTPLAEARPEAEQDAVIVEVLRKLWAAPLGGHPFRPLSQMCNAWADSAQARPITIDRGLARAGLNLLRELPTTATEQVLLATDLHAGNVLQAEREPWLVIDPKPYVGDPHYDVLQHLLNCDERLHHDPRALVHRVADLAGLDRDRVLAWLFARCVHASLDLPVLRPVATRLAGYL
ncbi:streptomycin 6-kinase [Kineosporia babensis]|nr:aminoglycoside phosphotransferase family protein [Kineosporia babensis]